MYFFHVLQLQMAFVERHKTSIQDVKSYVVSFWFSLTSKLTEGTDCGYNFKKYVPLV